MGVKKSDYIKESEATNYEDYNEVIRYDNLVELEGTSNTNTVDDLLGLGSSMPT